MENENIKDQDVKDTKDQETKPDEVKKEPEQKPEKKYSDEDIDKIISKKFAEWKSKEEKAVKEAERLAKLSAEEKANEERDKAVKRAEEAEAKLARLDLIKEARSILNEAKVSISEELLEMLVTNDADTTKANISNFTKQYQADVEAAVKARIAGNAPKSGGKATMTKEEIMAIKDNAERHAKIRENLELFTK